MISVILLAAGQSKRMKNENKLVKKIYGKPLIKHTLKNILNSKVDEILIIAGYQKKILKKIIYKNKKIKLINNPNFKTGIASSIKLGLKKLSKKNNGFFISLGDMPFVSKSIYNKLIMAKKNHPKKNIFIPCYKKKQGNPILFSKKMISEIKKIKGDKGAKKILFKNKNQIFKVNFKSRSIILDFNTRDSFDRLY